MTERAVSNPKIITLNDSQRADYMEAIKPLVEAAREAYQPILANKRDLKILDDQEKEVIAKLRAEDGSVDEGVLSNALIGIRLSREELKRSPFLREIKGDFRVRANRLIGEVNNYKAKLAVDNNLIQQGGTALVGQPQIKPEEGRNKLAQPDSPVRPHNALGTLSIYRPKYVRPDLAAAIKARTNNSTDLNSVSQDACVAVVGLVPEHFVVLGRSTPLDVRRAGDLSKFIVEVANLVGQYDSGLLQPPSDYELGQTSAEQSEHITTQLRALLAHFLREELVNPNKSESQLQSLYQELSNYIRKTTRHITSTYGTERSSYERVGLLIEQLPGIEGPMIAARLSTSLYEDLGLPCLDYMGEIRLAEVLRNVAGSIHFVRGNSKDMRAAEMIMPYGHKHLFAKVVDSITSRLDTDEIDCRKLFEAIESIDYGDLLIKNLMQAVEEEQEGILMRALMESGCFSDFVKESRRKKYKIEYDLE